MKPSQVHEVRQADFDENRATVTTLPLEKLATTPRLIRHIQTLCLEATKASCSAVSTSRLMFYQHLTVPKSMTNLSITSDGSATSEYPS